MNLFIFQPELLSTINIILGLRVGHWAATIVFSLCFVILFILGWLIFRKKFSFVNILIVAAAITWLPLFIHFSYNSIKEFNETWFILFQKEPEQIVWRYCRIDKYQNLNGTLCALYPFVEQLRKQIPKGSSVAYLRSSSQAFLGYFLFKDYDFIDSLDAQYLILYRPNKPHVYEDGLLYEDVQKTKLLGRFDIVSFFGPDQIIFKKH